jgi:hypothetical protein
VIAAEVCDAARQLKVESEKLKDHPVAVIF